MARPRRNFLPGRLYLVSQLGNKQNPVYLDEEDRQVASRFLHICALRYGVRVLAYRCGEFEGRWLLRPSSRSGVSNMMRDMQSAYSRYLNARYDHRPCCAHRRMAGLEPCHADGAEPITNSSNWTPRFRVTEITEDCYDAALDLIENLNVEQPGRDSSDPESGTSPPAEADVADIHETYSTERPTGVESPASRRSGLTFPEIKAAFREATRRSVPLGSLILAIGCKRTRQGELTNAPSSRYPRNEIYRRRRSP